MSNDIFENVKLIITNIIIGAVIVILGLYLQSGFLVVFGGLLAGAIPIFSLVLSIIERA